MTKTNSLDSHSKSKGKDDSTKPTKGHHDLRKSASFHTDFASNCGYFGWKPTWLQRLNTPRMLLACMFWYSFTHGFVVNGVIYTNFSSWERRYGLSSTQVAWIASSYDVVAAVVTLIFGYIGQWMHNGKILCAGAFFMSIGSLIMTLPHFISEEYIYGPKPIEVCDLSANQTIEECIASESTYYGYFIIAQCFHAVAGAAVYTLGIPYMDDQIQTKNTPMYIGIMEGGAALGPAMGFILGGYFITLYVDINKDVEVDISPGDPRWVGAWWIGLLYSGVASLTVAFFIGCFPRKLPSAKKYLSRRVSQAHNEPISSTTSSNNSSTFGSSLTEAKQSFKAVFTNPVWIFLTLSGTVESGAVIGFAAFLPKVMQFQFGQTPSRAAAFAGMVIVPGAAGGQILGGLVPKWLNLRMRGLLIQCIICSVVGLLLSWEFLIRCETIPIAGVTVPYFNSTLTEPDVNHPCNTACNCTTESYDPICGEDSIEYFSPCHAGCLYSEEDEAGDMVYGNCSCIESPSSNHGSAIGGICPTDCNSFGIFLLFFFFICLATFMSSTAGQAATIRCVPDRQRAFAFGVQRTIVRLLGNVPGPILIGAVFDTSCLILQEKCDGYGSCWIYDTAFISSGIFWTCLIVKAISALGFSLALLLYKPPKTEVLELDISSINKQEQEVNKQEVEKEEQEVEMDISESKMEGFEDIYEHMTYL